MSSNVSFVAGDLAHPNCGKASFQLGEDLVIDSKEPHA